MATPLCNIVTLYGAVLHGKKPLCGPRSLQSSPYHSPSRIMSPLDLHRSFAGEQLEEEEVRNTVNSIWLIT